jgi:hypothetical protein
MKKNKKVTADDELRSISRSLQKLLKLEKDERNIHRAQQKKIGEIQNVVDRLCDDKDIREKMEKDKEIFTLIQQTKNLISTIRTLLRQ